MKKVIVFIVIFIVSICLLAVLIFDPFSKKTNIVEQKAKLIYIYKDKYVEVELTNDESVLLSVIFNNRKLYSDNPSCGFTDDVSIRFGDMTFCIACDNCPIIKLGNKYFKISESDRKKVDEIFQKYGGSFPCL